MRAALVVIALAGSAHADAPTTCAGFSIHIAIALTSLDKQLIEREIELHRPQLRRCYMELAQRSRIEGTATLHFAVGGPGIPQDVEIETDPQLVATTACLRAVTSSFAFPVTQSPELVQINYPIAFKLRR